MNNKTDEDSSNLYAKIILALGIGVALIMPLFSIIISLLFGGNEQSKFATSGQIGDTLGGTIGPILNFVGLVLVYLSFKQQYIENKTQNRARVQEAELAHIDALMNQVNFEINSFNIEISVFSEDGNTLIQENKYLGPEAFIRFSRYLLNNHLDPHNSNIAIKQDYNTIESFALQAQYLLSLINLIVRNIEKSPSIEKDMLAQRLKGFFIIKLKTGFNNLVRYQKNNIENEGPVISEKFIAAFEYVNSYFEKVILK